MNFSSEYVSADFLKLNSCGIQDLSGTDIDMHRKNGRKDYYLLYIRKGRCYINSPEKSCNITEGNLILFRPGISQEYYFRKKDNSATCYIHFTGSACDGLLKDIGLENQNILYIGKNRLIDDIYTKMAKEYTLKKPFYENMCTAYLLEFFSLIARIRISNTKPEIDRVCMKMHENYAKNYSIKVYADMCNLSVSRFSHIFKDSVGCAPLEYVIKSRIEYAKELLIKSSLSISEIAELAGFSNQNYFSRMFKKHTGLSPTQFCKI